MKKKIFPVCFLMVLTLILMCGCAEEKVAVFAEAGNEAGGEKIEPTPSPTPTPTPTPTPEPTPEPVYKVKLTAVGDLMCHQWQLDNAYNMDIDAYDFRYCYEDVRDYLSEAHITLGNLETVFAGKERGYSDFPIFNSPDEFGEALKYAGFDVLTTTNNHCNDKGQNGLIRTLDVLDELGLKHFGTYRDQEASEEILIMEEENIRFAFLSYTYGTNGIPLAEPYLANLMDENKIIGDIKKAKALEPDFIIVAPHMGNEYETYPKEIFKNWARLMLEAGADIILASHPHVLQPAEFVEVQREDGSTANGFVIYSLGNFISSQRTLPRDRGIILNMEFEIIGDAKAELSSVSYIPTWVKFVNSAGRYEIKVLSVYDALTAVAQGRDIGLRPKDISRLKDVSREISNIYLGKEIPLEEIQNEYTIFRRTEG